MTTATETTQSGEQRAEALANRLFAATIGAMEIVGVYIGDKLGYYAALSEGSTLTEGAPPPEGVALDANIDGAFLTSAELAARTSTNERYAREWLEQQAVCGIIDVEDAAAPPLSRRYSLPAAFRAVLLDPESMSYMAPLGRMLVGTLVKAPALLDAYRSGGGVPWADYGPDVIESQAAFNRPAFKALLTSDWLPAITDVHARLAKPGARVADIGCGGAWSAIEIARAYPEVHVDGFDPDPSSIEIANDNISAAGLQGRVEAHCRDAADPTLTGRYDLVTAFECIHDLSQPVEVLRTARRLLAPGGAMLVMDERTQEHFTPNAGEIEQLLYGFSLLVCLPAALSETPSAGTGTVMRPATLESYAKEAGFAKMTVLPIEHDLFRFYRLDP